MTATVFVLWGVVASTTNFAWAPIGVAETLKQCRYLMTVPENQIDAHGFTISEWKCVRYRIAP